jgi:putative SOS response-associated peptidase YedK
VNAQTTIRPTRKGRIIVWQDDEPVQVEMTWGLAPFEPRGRPISLLRSEGRAITNPCLIIANDFGLKVDGAMKYRASLNTSAPFFCIAGVWRAGQREWPDAYAALTTEAYPDLAPYKDRHVAVVRQADWRDWLQQSRSVAEMLRPFPEGSFTVKGPNGRMPRARTSKPAVADLFD